MMVDSVTAESESSDPAFVDGNLAGQATIASLLRAQSTVPSRSRLSRLMGVTPLSLESQPLFTASLGEIQVGESLDALGAGWTVLHSLPVDAECVAINHLVIGRAGVFIVDTRSFPGGVVWTSGRSFMVGGVRHPYIRAMEFEMGRVERMLSNASGRSVEVSGLLAIVAPKSLTVHAEQRDVAVVDSTDIVSWLRSLPAVLSAAEVSQIAEAASRASAWERSNASATVDSNLSRFASLRREVRAAWRTRVLWASGIGLAGAASFLGMTYTILLGALAP